MLSFFHENVIVCLKECEIINGTFGKNKFAMLPKRDLDLKIKIWSRFSKIWLLNFQKCLKHGRFYKNDQVRWISAYNFLRISAYRFKVITYKKRRDIICPLYS